MTGKLSRNCIITNIKRKSKTAPHNSIMEQVTFAMAGAASVKAAATPSQATASGKCQAAAVPLLLPAQEVVLLSALRLLCQGRQGGHCFLVLPHAAERRQRY